ncbi:Retrovirus-related Pol polyprotein from transposon 17.6, partial [Mucuna pruriens]
MEERIKFQQNMNATMHDLKMQIRQLANSISQLQSARSRNLPPQPIPNPKGGKVSIVTLRSDKELQAKTTPLPFPSRTISIKKPETDEELLKMFRRVEINIPLLDAIKQIPKYAKFLKELSEVGGVLSAFIQKEVIVGTKPALPRKYRDPGVFSVPYTIGGCTFANAMLDLGASFNVMLASVYKSLNFGDLELTGIVIQLANRSVVQPIGLLEDVLIQVNDLIFPTDFYVLKMEDETSKKGSTLILGRPFLMTARTKIDVHARTLSMEFEDNLVQFNIFDAMRYPTEDHSLYSMDPRSIIDSLPPQSPPSKLKSLLDHLKYAYLDQDQQFLVIIANNLDQEQEEKFLAVLWRHKKSIGWKLLDLLGSFHLHAQNHDGGRSPSYTTIAKEIESDHPGCREESAEIIYPILDSNWVSPVQVVPKKSGITVTKNQYDEMVPTRIHNSWRVCIDYTNLNQATRKDHFPLPFLDQILEKLVRKSHYCFLDGYSGYMQIHIAREDQHKTTFTYPFGTFAYTKMSFGLCNAPSTFRRCMLSIFSDLLEECMEVFMNDFMVYANTFEACLGNLSCMLKRCMETNLVLNYENFHFMVIEGIVLGHLVSNRGIKVEKAKIDVITSLPKPALVRDVCSFLGHAGFYRRFIRNFSKIALPLSKLLQKDLDFVFDEACAPNWELPFELICDASNSALGAILGQRVGTGKPAHMVAYASRTMDPA